ncbi:MAG: periplasmic heavy metal sensor [Methyloligellaceae bacterium]
MSSSENGDNGERSGRMPRWVWIALIASLALNLVMIGSIGGAVYAGRHGGFWGGHRHSADARTFMSSLPDERRKELKTLFREHRKSLRPYWRKVRRARRGAAEVLKEDPFDKVKFTAALEKLHQLHVAARAASRPMFVDLAGKLNPDERKVFMRSMRPRFLGLGRRRGHRRGRFDRDGSPPDRRDNVERREN